MNIINYDNYSIVDCKGLVDFNALLEFLNENKFNYPHLIINLLF